MRTFNHAPLPFQGQKRNFINKFKQCLNDFNPTATYVDLFGGSGLLSHTVKQKYPEAEVVWNDFDNYQKRLDNIAATNELISELRPLVKGLGSKERLPNQIRKEVLEVVKNAENKYGWVDYITLSSNLLFSMNFAFNFGQLAKGTMYSRLRSSEYHSLGFLDGVKRIQGDYKTLFNRYNKPGVVFLVDPPYLSTDTQSYNRKDYWKLNDYLDVLRVLEDSNYIYFTSNKSQIVELCEWIETRTHTGNPFEGSTVTTTSNQVNRSSRYTDIMLHKSSRNTI